MASTLTDLRDLLRPILNDITGPDIFSDDVLNQALVEAVAEHSYLFPWATQLKYPLVADQQALAIYPLDDPGGPPGPTAPTNADLLRVYRVECPPGTVLPQDPDPVTDPAASRSTRYKQAWRFWGGVLYFRNPAAGPEVTYGALIDIVQTWIVPDAADVKEWNGPVTDLPLLLLLAARVTFQLLEMWQAIAQGLTVPTIAGTSTNVHIDTVPILRVLDTEIARAIKRRQARQTHSRPLDI